MPNLLANPILRREFRAAARNGKSAAVAAATLLALGALLLALWPRTGIFSDANSAEIFSLFLGAELTFMILLTPGFTASSITAERERDTFAMLATSLLTPGEILAGKLVGALGMPLLLLLLTLPITAICALSGGIGLATLLRAGAVIAVATLVYGLLGLAVSALCRRSYAALLITYAGVATLAGATWLPAVLMGASPWQPFLLKLRALSPFEALFALQFTESYELAVTGMDAGRVFQFHLAGMGALAVLFLLVFARFVLNPPQSRKATTRQLYADTKTTIKRKLGFPFYLIDPLRRKKPIPAWRNPVFVAELRSKIFGNPKFIIRALTACMAMSIGLLILIAQQYATQIDADTIRGAAIIFQLGVVALLAPAVASGSITDEKSSDTILLLRLSPLSPLRVVAGKLKASWMYVMIFLLSSLPVFLSLVYLESTAAYWRVAAWAGVLLATCLVLTAGGLCASAFAPDTGTATAVSYAFSLLLTAGSLVVIPFGNRIGPGLKTAVLSLNPFVAALQITQDKSPLAQLPSLFGNRLWENHLIAFASLAALLLFLSAWRVHHLFRERR
ncbi:MAG: hypothetical protein WC789_14220 [Lentisphaeria bacterium]|jgi:ABC-type transport system involved in multi-copper enzyme maturation permease subunit